MSLVKLNLFNGFYFFLLLLISINCSYDLASDIYGTVVYYDQQINSYRLLIQ